jgi:hypothetical protein
MNSVDPAYNDTSSSVPWLEEESTFTGQWQLVPPIITGRVPAIQLEETTATVRAPAGSEVSVQEEQVALFDVRFLGQDNLQYNVSAHVTRLYPQKAQGAVLNQLHSVVRVPTQPKNMTDPLPTLLAPPSHVSEHADESSRSFLLRVIQPGLVGLMDGSVSTLAPIFATAFATHRPLTTFLVGMASATGAGISMAFAEALSDDGELTGRGNALMRGGITGLMTFLSGAGHTLPFLVPNIHLALLFAYVVVAIELIAIAAIRHRFFNTSWWLSILQVVGGGALVFVAAMLFGNA